MEAENQDAMQCGKQWKRHDSGVDTPVAKVRGHCMQGMGCKLPLSEAKSARQHLPVNA